MGFRVQLAKRGNSLGLHVPKDVAQQIGLSAGMRVDVEAQPDGSVILHTAKPKYTLEELVAGMTPDKEHPPWDDPPRGEELL